MGTWMHEPPPERQRGVGDATVGATTAREIASGDGSIAAFASTPGDPRVVPLVAELRRRLRPACRGWDEAAFEALLHHMARTKLRWTDEA